ncbi:MAG: ABC transporter substrate-binding protein [Vulcanimicrobiaceae bacterium]
MSHSRIARRTFVTGTAAVTGAAAFGVPAFIPKLGSAAETIPVGVTEELTGVYADPARNEQRGMQLAVDERNKRGGVLGRPIQLVVEDSDNNPGIGVEKARKMIQVDKVVALMGCVNSAVAQATSGVAFENSTPFIDTGGHTDTVTGIDCHWTTFRVCHSTWMETHATGNSIATKFGKKWYMLAPDYAFGHSLVTGYLDVAKTLGINIVGNDLAPLGTTDYSAYITKVIEAKPDCFIIMQQGTDLIDALKQCNSSGLLRTIPVAGPQGELENFWALPTEARVGYWGYEWYYNSPKVIGNSQSARAFIKAYAALYGNPPTERSAFGYIATTALINAIDHAKSLDAVKICRALEAVPVDALCYTSTQFRTVDHQLNWPMWFGNVRPNGTPGQPLNLFNVLDAHPGPSVMHSPDEQAKICHLGYP